MGREYPKLTLFFKKQHKFRVIFYILFLFFCSYFFFTSPLSSTSTGTGKATLRGR